MLPLPPPPPPPPTPLLLPAQRETMATPPNQIRITKQAINQQALALDIPYRTLKKLREEPVLRLRQPRRTNPLIWCGAILCLIFSLLLIFFGIATLIIFLVIRPRYPAFDISAANLDVIYFDSPEYFNGDFTLLANFSNPNQKLDARFEYLFVELHFSDSLIATQALQSFIQRKGETRSVSVRFISSLVYLPPNLSLELQKQVQINKVSYNIRGAFKVKVTLGLIHYSYWLHTRCQLEMTGPPNGVLISHSCRTKR